MDGYTLSISRCSGGDGVEESFKAKIKRREAALDAFAVAEAYCKESWMVSRCEREGFDGFIIDLCSDAEDETIRLVRLVPDSEDGGCFSHLRFRLFSETWLLRYSPCARHFPSPSVTGLCAHPIPVSSVFQTGQKGLLTCTRF